MAEPLRKGKFERNAGSACGSAIPKGLCPSAQGCEERATLGCCRGDFQPQRGCVKFPPLNHNPVGVVCLLPRFPRVARSSQPWALCRNPVGIQRWNFRKALPQAQIVGAMPATVSVHLSTRKRFRGCLKNRSRRREEADSAEEVAQFSASLPRRLRTSRILRRALRLPAPARVCRSSRRRSRGSEFPHRLSPVKQ